ncbi:Uncharacterized protein PECH_000138 [Penicillium ucsense]|uniref:MOSC domain-containing protein n=1 Tax=Penicillium ucsense TaxID=2839758 RepID=A0A8J8W4A8_9EURO|nr:Uncharacterized protein PECM_005777 [Penicillium ucsense]KAF7739618.1 Uncharacterized protein PECH_000138 [Penicillium ucsense]
MWAWIEDQVNGDSLVKASPLFVGFALLSSAILAIVPLLTLAKSISRSRALRQSPPGCKRLGLPFNQSHLSDEFDRKYAQGTSPDSKDEDGLPSWRVKALFTYPIKSCRGIELEHADVVSTGLQYDRQFAFAQQTPKGWVCRTLRNAGFERMARIHAEIWIPDPSSPSYETRRPEIRSGGVMIVSYPRVTPPGLVLGTIIKTGVMLGLVTFRESFTVPLQPETPAETDSPSQPSYPLRPVTIWKDSPLAHDYAIHLPPSLHQYLGFHHPSSSPITLFRAHSTHPRNIYRNAPRKAQLGFQPQTAFADAYPLHLLTLSSHHDVAARCASSLPHLSIRRFRANIIIQGPGPFAEDQWKKVRIGNTDVYAACRTIRCLLPNVDPDTGVRHASQPDRTLKGYRRVDEGDLTNACLGLQLVPGVREWVVRVGDEVRVLETGVHRYIKMLARGEKVEGV